MKLKVVTLFDPEKPHYTKDDEYEAYINLSKSHFERSFNSMCCKTTIHFYLIDTKKEINEGDYVYGWGEVIKWNSQKQGTVSPTGYFKIIASTDKLPVIKSYAKQVIRNLPQLSKQSIKLLLDYYSENGKTLEEVELKTKQEYFKGDIGLTYKNVLKLNSEGTVDIIITKPVTYTEEEVIKLLHLALATGAANGDKMNQENANSWVENNKKK